MLPQALGEIRLVVCAAPLDMQRMQREARTVIVASSKLIVQKPSVLSAHQGMCTMLQKKALRCNVCVQVCGLSATHTTKAGALHLAPHCSQVLLALLAVQRPLQLLWHQGGLAGGALRAAEIPARSSDSGTGSTLPSLQYTPITIHLQISV